MENTFSFPNTEAIIFDMDGVIIDTKEMVEHFWINKFKEHNLDVPKNNFEERFHGRPSQLIIKQEFSSLSKAEQSAMEEEIKEYDSNLNDFTLIPGIQAFLQQCKDARIPIALVTSALPPKVEVMKNSLSLDPDFVTEVTADRISNGKPNPECYNLALHELDTDPGNVIVFEDSISGVQAAAGSNANVIGVNEPHLHEILLKNGASHAVRNFENAIIHSDKALLRLTSA